MRDSGDSSIEDTYVHPTLTTHNSSIIVAVLWVGGVLEILLLMTSLSHDIDCPMLYNTWWIPKLIRMIKSMLPLFIVFWRHGHVIYDSALSYITWPWRQKTINSGSIDFIILINFGIHQVLYNMGQSISCDSDVIKSSISKTPPTHKTATIIELLCVVKVGWTYVSSIEESPESLMILVSFWRSFRIFSFVI